MNPEQDTPNLGGDSLDDYLTELASERGYSADTVFNEETNFPEIDTNFSETQKPELSDKQAWDNTEVLFNLRETVQSYSLSYFVDGNFKQAAQYDYDKEEKERLIRAWSRVIGHYRITVSPWVDVILTEAVCTGPLVALAYNNRQQRKELELQRKEIARLQRENLALKNESSGRRDTKTAWKIDENGYYEYSEANTYIPKNKRKERPALTPDNYQLLIKHNGKDFVDKIYDIKNEQQ